MAPIRSNPPGSSSSGTGPQDRPEPFSSRLTCAQCERMVQDALDGTLGPEDQVHFDLHRLSCAGCTRELTDAQQGAAWMEMLKAAPPEPPAALVSAILAQTSGNPAELLPALRVESLLQPVPGTGPAGAVPIHAAAAYPVWARLPMMAQPRFAMTAAMAFFSLALTMNLTGVHLADIHLSDLRPSAVRRSFWGANARAIRYYDNLRVVYELQSRVREMQRENGDPADAVPVRSPVPAEPVPVPQGTPPATKRSPLRPGEEQPAGGVSAQPRSSSGLPGGSHPDRPGTGQPVLLPAAEPPLRSRRAESTTAAALSDFPILKSQDSLQSREKGARA